MTPVPLRLFWPIVILVSGYAYGSGVKNVDLSSAGRRSGPILSAGDLVGGAAEASYVEYVDSAFSLEPLYDFLIELRLHKLCKLLREAQLEDILLDTGPLTIFAPTDGSFVFLPGGTLEEIRKNPQWLRDFILHHIVAGDISSQQILDELVVTSLQGSPLRFNIYGSGQVYTVSGSQILSFDLPFQLGRLHVIDHPLYPIPEGDLVRYLPRTHSQLYRLVLSTGLAEELSGRTYTIFAPDDSAFGYLSQDFLDVLNRNKSLAERIVLNHVVPGSIYTRGIANGMQLDSVGGGLLSFTESRGLTFVNGIPIVTPDIPVTNGVVHVINRVLLPEDIDTDCHCKSTRRGSVSDVPRTPSRTPAGESETGGGQPGSRQPQVPGIGTQQTRRPSGQTGPPRIPSDPHRSGQPQTPSTSTGIGSGTRPGSPHQTQGFGRPSVGGPIQGPRTPIIDTDAQGPGSPHRGSGRPSRPHGSGQSQEDQALPQDTEAQQLPDDNFVPGQPRVPGSTLGTGHVQRPGSSFGTGQPQEPDSPFGTGQPQSPGSTSGTRQHQIPGSSLETGRQPELPDSSVEGQPQIPFGTGSSRRPGTPFGTGQQTVSDNIAGTGSSQRPGSSFEAGQPQSPGSTFGARPAQRPGTAFVRGQQHTTGGTFGTEVSQRPGTSFGTGQRESPDSSFGTGTDQRPGGSFETGQPHTPSNTFDRGSQQRPGSAFGTGQSQGPGSSFGTGRPSHTPGSHVTKGQTQRRGQGHRPQSTPSPRYPQRPGSEIREPQSPESDIGISEHPGSGTREPQLPGSGLPQRPGSPGLTGQPPRPGSSPVVREPQSPGSGFENEYPGSTDETDQLQVPESPFETADPQRVGSILPEEQPGVPGRTKINQPGRVPLPPPPTRAPPPSRTRTTRYPGSHQRGPTGPVSPQDEGNRFGGSPGSTVRGPYRPTRAPPTSSPHGSRYPRPGTQSRVTPTRSPLVTSTYPDSQDDSAFGVLDQTLQPGRTDSRKQPSTQSPRTQPDRHRTPQQPPFGTTRRPTQLPPTERPSVGQPRPVPTRAPVSRTGHRPPTNCRQPGDRITPANRNFPLCSAQDVSQEPCQSLDRPYDPSDPRPVCPGSGFSDGCRNALEPPGPNDRRPVCPISQRRPNCREYNEPRDGRPLCPGATRNCRLPEEPEDPLNPLPVCQNTPSVQGCRRPDDPYDPQDRRPECPPDDCRPPQEPLRRGDRRPLCTVNEEDAFRQPLAPTTTTRPQYPQQPRPGSQPAQIPGRPGKRPSESVTSVGSRPQTPSWQRPQTQPHSPQQPTVPDSLTTRRPGKQPQSTPVNPGDFIQPASPEDNDALISPEATPHERPTYPGSPQGTRHQGEPSPGADEPSQSQPGRPHSTAQRPSGHPDSPHTTPQRPGSQSGYPQSTGQRTPGQPGSPHTVPQRPGSQSGYPHSTGQRQTVQTGSPHSTPRRPVSQPGYPSRQPGSPHTTPQRPGSQPGYPSGQPGSPHTTPQRPDSQTGYPQGERPFAGQRPPLTPQRPQGGSQPSPSPGSPGGGDDSTRSLLDIVQDPGLQIKGHPVKLTTILDLFEKAGLVDILEGPGPQTTFLPSDDAFKKLPRGVVEQLRENPELLRQVLLYHIVGSEVRPSTRETSFTVPTRQGMSLVITMLKDGRLILIGGAKAVAVTRASNGIFYVINELLYPLPHEDIVSALKSRPDLTQVTSLVQRSGLTHMLTGSQPFTLFAPTDTAFSALPERTVEAITQNNTAIRELLLGHIVEGAHFGREFLAGGVFPNARGGKLRFRVLSYGYTVNDANIKTPEIVTGTGVIHLIDQVLLEPEELETLQDVPRDSPAGDVNVVRIDHTESYENYPEISELARGMGLNRFLSWITNTGLIDKVHDGGSYTILAPTDAAVNSLPGNLIEAIDTDPDQVRPLLKFHIITQHIDLNNIRNEQTVATLLPDKRIRFNLIQDGLGQVVTACGVPITEAQGSGSVRLIPVNLPLYPPTGSLAQVIEASPILTNLAKEIRTYHLTWMFTGQGSTTIFAPSDAAFEALSDEDRKNLIENRQAFTDLLKRHIVKGSIFSTGMQDGMKVRNDKREDLTFSVRPGGISVNSIPISYSDVTATNGVLHVIDHFL